MGEDSEPGIIATPEALVKYCFTLQISKIEEMSRHIPHAADAGEVAAAVVMGEALFCFASAAALKFTNMISHQF